MELFLPSLIILIIAGFFVFFVIPRVSPLIIFILCIVFLFIVVQAHYNMFKDEYKLNTWRDQLKVLATPILISIIVLGVLFSSLHFILGLHPEKIIYHVQNFLSPIGYSKYKNISPSKLDELEKEI